MSTVFNSQAAVNSQDCGRSISPAVAHALAVAGNSLAGPERENLPPGKHAIDATIRIVGTLKVGHDSTGARSVTPDATEVLAYVLSQLNERTRSKILRDLPVAYVNNGNNVPRIDAAILAQTAGMLQQLRRSVEQFRHGAVTGDFDVQLCTLESVDGPTDLSIVG